VKEAVPILWINPPSEHSPLPVKGSVRDAVVTAGPAGSTEFALHAKPIRVPAANCFQVFEGDEALARAGDCPVVVVRGAVGHPRSAIIGFDPLAPSLRFGVETPLLFARLMDELSPAAFRERAFAAERVGLTRVSLNRGEQSGSLRVRDDRGQNLPFTRRASELQFFTLEPATVHVTSDRKERILSLQLPAVGDRAWGAADVVQGLPQTAVAESAAVDLWKWLAGAAATLLLLEWFLFGRGARGRIRRARTRATSESRAERELALK
jgi:hypothetical protein